MSTMISILFKNNNNDKKKIILNSPLINNPSPFIPETPVNPTKNKDLA
jgi:hypothetical protein